MSPTNLSLFSGGGAGSGRSGTGVGVAGTHGAGRPGPSQVPGAGVGPSPAAPAPAPLSRWNSGAFISLDDEYSMMAPLLTAPEPGNQPLMDDGKLCRQEQFQSSSAPNELRAHEGSELMIKLS